MAVANDIIGKSVPHASHFCMSDKCRFGVTTACKSHCVSSVGGLPDGEIIGHERTHETYVFKWAGTFCECGCGRMIPSDIEQVDSLPANSDSECAANHVALVLKWLNV